MKQKQLNGMKIALIGYGKMGKQIEQIALSRGHEIVSIIDINNTEDFDSEAFRSADVAIEFTSPTTAYANCKKAFEQGVKVVSGSTGWMAQHSEEMLRLCAEQGKTLFWSSNFSLGVSIFTAVNRFLAHVMNQFDGYDVSMSETHHVHKLDHPSGTAITLAEGILAELDRKDAWVDAALVENGEMHQLAQPKPDELPIISERRGEVPGIHMVRYESDADSITIVHDAKNRSGFALGAVLAAEYTATHQGFLKMSDLFTFLK